MILAATDTAQTALVGAISPADMTALVRACTEANLQFSHVALAPIEIARYSMASGKLTQAAHLVVCLSRDYADLLVVKAGQVVLVRGTKLPDEQEHLAKAIAGEVRRSLMAASSQLSASPISSVMLMATPQLAALTEVSIADAASAPVIVA